jgi:hypothetical protein
MAKTIEIVKDAVKEVTDAVKDAFKGVEADAVIASFQALLNSQKHCVGVPYEWSYMGPAEKLLGLMRAASGPEGLPKNADQLVSWLKVHYYRHPNKKLFRDAYISLELTPSWAGRKCTLIRLERAPRLPKEYPIVPF